MLYVDTNDFITTDPTASLTFFVDPDGENRSTGACGQELDTCATGFTIFYNGRIVEQGQYLTAPNMTPSYFSW